MEKIESFDKALQHLNEGCKIFLERENFFIQSGKMIYQYKKGSRFHFSLSLFEELFINEKFYLCQEENIRIDESKDEEYYRYYRK